MYFINNEATGVYINIAAAAAGYIDERGTQSA